MACARYSKSEAAALSDEISSDSPAIDPQPVDPPTVEPPARDPAQAQAKLRRVLLAGRISLVLSILFLYLSKTVDSDTGAGNVLWATYLMLARLCGLTSFAIGGVAIFNGRWTEGVLLMLVSIVLPVVAFLVYGTI